MPGDDSNADLSNFGLLDRWGEGDGPDKRAEAPSSAPAVPPVGADDAVTAAGDAEPPEPVERVEEPVTEPVVPEARPLPGAADLEAMLAGDGDEATTERAADSIVEEPLGQDVDPVPVEAVTLDDRRERRAKPKVSAISAAIMSIVPGAGHFYLGQVGKAVLFVALAFGGCCGTPMSGGLAMITVVTVAVVDAYLVGRRLERGERVGTWKFF